jgi:energy-coupling factor transporter ATP-binding protein EcfA2
MGRAKSVAGTLNWIILLFFGCTAGGALLMVPERVHQALTNIVATFESTSTFVIWTAGLLIPAAMTGALLVAGYIGFQMARSAFFRADFRRSEAVLQRRDASIWFSDLPPGHQLYKHELRQLPEGGYTSETVPLHLTAGRSNGRPVDFDPEEWQAWQVDRLANATGRYRADTAPALAAPDGIGLEPILPKLTPAQRLIITGGSDAGKSTLVKHLIAARSNHSKIILIDPHAPNKVLGHDVIGTGRDFEAIGRALESLVWLMTTRYQDVRDGILGYGDHERVSVFIEEWTSIQRKVERAGEWFETLLTESRKVNIHLTVISHSPNVDTLGVSAQIRKSAIIVELIGGQGQRRRAFIHPNSKINPDGTKAKPTEYALPGPFLGHVKPAGEVVLELPDARVLQAQAMEADGESVTAIAKVYHGVERPNGEQINEVRELLQRAKAARETHARATTTSRFFHAGQG